MEMEAEALALVAETPQPLFFAGARSDSPAEALIAEARRRRASHIHIETAPAAMIVRMRIAGQLTEPRHYHADPSLISEFSALVGAAILTQGESERIVLRIDGGEQREHALEAIGMSRAMVDALLPALRRGGLVLVAGGPGSGRSTTIAALLRHFSGSPRHIVTIGTPPVEGATRIEGIAGAAAIRAALEQDPDIIALDGLDGREAAAAAAEAAESGHLVLASIDAPDAVSAIRRMRDWRVEPFRLASTVAAVLAQRQVRRLCSDCRRPVQAQGSVSALLGFDSGAIVFEAMGCESCEGTGFTGRTGVFEAIVADGAIRRLINDGGDEAILARHAFLRAPNLGSAARALVREGVTTPEEAVRISRG
ncbi:general secretion pathway protein E [Sphingomonas kyeonggiensis]|uniref:GspE/PulE family protein n=1 Tax=Sphingomonas kyeonggiensis TaxID=1268553 RepID=UPI002786FC85|nr:ATPase, T2SS/T4P/T4SS family [Sphingomonas kyeonggiensis]MDQ0250469.1 general secretion pathway protein E [Sphingomonas kyeonggiensis]